MSEPNPNQNPKTTFSIGEDETDITELFQPGTSSVMTGYNLPGKLDLSYYFADIATGTPLGYNTGFVVNNYNGVTGSNKDLSEIFAAKIPQTIPSTNLIVPVSTNTFTRTIINGYTIISFLSGDGKICIDSLETNTFHYLVVGGGGDGGKPYRGGGGGGGAVLQGTFTIEGKNILNIKVGNGGVASLSVTTTIAEDSIISYDSTTLRALAGGSGSYENIQLARNGGCGGGGSTARDFTAGGIGNPGKNGGNGVRSSGSGGGGGMGTAGGNGYIIGAIDYAGNGGDGVPCTNEVINLLYPSTLYWGGGGGGGGEGGNGGRGGKGGGGRGAYTYFTPPFPQGADGTANTGGGGGGSDTSTGLGSYPGGNGGSGIVVIGFLTPT